MNILRIARKLPPRLGGQEYHVVDLSRYQVAQGNSVEISFGLGHHPEPAAGINSRRVVPERLLSVIPIDVLQAAFFGVMVMFSHLLRRRSGVSVVHVHGDVIDIAFAWVVSKLHDARLIVTFHAGLSHKAWYHKIASKVLRLPDSIICVSSDIADQVREIVPLMKNVHSIHSGIYRDRYLSAKHCHYAPPLEVVSVGRLHPMKGYSYLISALADNKLKDKVRLMLVGDGPERAVLEALAQRLEANVCFMGQRSKEEVVKHLHRSHLFVSSSVQLGKQTEGTPTAVMEAMAAGLPVVVTDVGGAKSLIKDGENGFVIPQADQLVLIEAIRRFVDNPGLIDEQSRRNVEDSIQFDWKVVGSLVEKVYLSV